MQFKTIKLYNHRLGARLGAFALILASSTTAQSWIVLDSFPYTQNFEDPSYESTVRDQNLVWTTQGATHTWLESGGWRGGGAAKFTPPTLNEGYSGLGQIHFPGDGTNQINVRFLIYHGTTWEEYGPGNKLAIINREESFGGRAMVISRTWDSEWVTWGACDGTVCNYQGGDYWPDGTDEFRIGNPPDNREEEWISVEIEAFADTGVINLYIHTADGELSGLYTSQTMARPGNIYRYVDILGGYMGRAVQEHPDNYFIMDELVVDDSYIGPPEGFVDGDVSASNVYYATNPLLRALSVMSLADNNTVTAGDQTLTLDLYERGSLYSPDARVITPGMAISATGPLDMGSITRATDTPIHSSMMGRSFAMPHLRYEHNYHMLSPEQDATVEIMVDGTVHRRTLPRGELVSFNAGNSNGNVSAVITSDTPIAVSHSAQVGTIYADALPLPGAATELWGIRSTVAAIGATEDDTQVSVYASDGTTQQFTMQQGEKRVVTVGAGYEASRQGAGSAIHIVASKPVNAIQVADGDGLDATAFYPTSLLNTRFGIPKDTQYIAIACPEPNTRIALYRPQRRYEARSCSAEGTQPGKALYGVSDSNRVMVPQGSYLESNNPIHVIYEVTGSEDEHNLIGAPAM